LSLSFRDLINFSSVVIIPFFEELYFFKVSKEGSNHICPEEGQDLFSVESSIVSIGGLVLVIDIKYLIGYFVSVVPVSGLAEQSINDIIELPFLDHCVAPVPSERWRFRVSTIHSVAIGAVRLDATVVLGETAVHIEETE